MARRGFSYAVVRPMIDEKLEERRREWDIESEERQ
jgi:hypothetical protein